MATLITTKKGKKIVLLNPAERSKRYAREMQSGIKHDGTPLTSEEKAFRAGVLNERGLQAKIYNKENGLQSRSRRRRNNKNH